MMPGSRQYSDFVVNRSSFGPSAQSKLRVQGLTDIAGGKTTTLQRVYTESRYNKS